MLLVMIALVVTTILCAAALTSRDNSPAIGANASNTTKAQWSAVSGALFVSAAVEQNAEELAQRIASLDVDPEFISNLAIAGGNIRVTVTRPDGTPYEQGDRLLLLNATGSVEGIDVDVSKLIMLPPQLDAAEALDLSHNEFAIFATNSLNISNGAKIANWQLSPDFAANTPVKIGVSFDSGAALTMPANPSLGAVSLYLDADANPALGAGVASLGLNAVTNLPVAIPAVMQALPNALAALSAADPPDLIVGSGQSITVSEQVYDNVDVTNAMITFDASVHTEYAIDELTLNNASKIRIVGDVSIYIDDHFDLRDASRIALAPNASLRLYLGDGLRVRSGSMIGVHVIESGSNWASLQQYVFPNRIQIYQLGDDDDASVTIDGGATLIGCIYAPAASVELDGSGATLIGRVTAANFTMRAGSRLLYDPRLDSFAGLTTLTGPLYNDNGTPIPGLVDALVAAETAVCLDDMTTFATDSLR